MRKRVWMRPPSVSWRVTSRLRRTTNNRPSPWRSGRWHTWSKPVSRRPRMPLAPRRRFRPRMTAALTARRQSAPWSRWGLIRTWRRPANDTMPRRPRKPTRPPPLRSAWRRTCGHAQDDACTQGVQASWRRCLVRSKKAVGSGGFCCAACRKSGVNGVGCVGPILCARSGATRARRSPSHPKRGHQMCPKWPFSERHAACEPTVSVRSRCGFNSSVN